MPMRTGVVKSSAAEGVLKTENVMLWHHIENYRVSTVDEGVDRLRKGKLDVLLGDQAIFEYYKAVDPDCSLRILGEPVIDDTYAVGMPKEFPLKDAISDLLLEYSNYGFMDQLKKKWFQDGETKCGSRTRRPTPLTFLSVSGVYLFLVCGVILAILTLCIEHMIMGGLPDKRKKPKTTFWKTRTGQFFSQKIYRFVNGPDQSSHYSDIGSEDGRDSRLSNRTVSNSI